MVLKEVMRSEILICGIPKAPSEKSPRTLKFLTLGDADKILEFFPGQHHV
jgi:hypothetical protein